MIRKKDSNQAGNKRKRARTDIMGNTKIKDLLDAMKIKKEKKDRMNFLVMTNNGVEKLFPDRLGKKNAYDSIVVEILVIIVAENNCKIVTGIFYLFSTITADEKNRAR